MKKIAMFLAAAAIAVSASAQKTAVTANKAGDNWYVGINAGAATPLSKYGYDMVRDGKAGFFKGVTPEFGIRVGKNLTTVFGLALDVDAYFANNTNGNVYHRGKAMVGSKTFVNSTIFNIMSTWNLMNAFGGYKGEPRKFEIIALAGGGYTRDWANRQGGLDVKAAFDFALNLGANKEWQVYAEPYVMFANGWNNPFRQADLTVIEGEKKLQGMLGLKFGVNYKFKNSNGTHNYAIEQLRDQAEIDALNSKINGLRGENDGLKASNAAKDAEIANLKKALADCQNKPVVDAKVANLQPSVVFKLAKSNVEKSQMPNVEMIANYMKAHKDAKIKISGYASPEGKAEYNQKLSEKRAAAVKDVLVKRYKVEANRIETEGLGATDKLFEELEFNRVAIFNDTTK
jgi:outer membrane protein OmpA-like peptidoglycan-associated protein